ncbi:MAG: Transcriptional regulator, TetR family [Thermotogales bacterium 46_20]|nr:MAG: Transcriptional regulator, TetR family [Thermotogales bacterium 46_20]
MESMPDRISTRNRILRAARKAFAERGRDGVSMSEIAREAGVQKALIYYYFPSKEDLFYEVWQYSLDELEEHVFAEASNESIYLKKLKKLLRSYINFITSRDEVRKIMERERANIASQPESTWSKVRDRYDVLRKKISSVIDGAKREDKIPEDVDSEDAADLIINAINTAHDSSGLESIGDIIWRGLVNQDE